MAGIFKAYDIRGIYGETLTDDIAFKIGRAIFSFLGCKKVVVGRDMRPIPSHCSTPWPAASPCTAPKSSISAFAPPPCPTTPTNCSAPTRPS